MRFDFPEEIGCRMLEFHNRVAYRIQVKRFLHQAEYVLPQLCVIEVLGGLYFEFFYHAFDHPSAESSLQEFLSHFPPDLIVSPSLKNYLNYTVEQGFVELYL